MRESTSIIAQRLLNLYRQAHVINGGWPAVNQVFINEASEAVFTELEKLPGGTKLAIHIKNLKFGKTKMDQIDRELMPYNGMMNNNINPAQVSSKDLQELGNALTDFQPDEEHIDKIKKLNIVQSFGENWVKGVRSALLNNPDLLSKWNEVSQTARAYDLWNEAYAILTPPISERARAQAQADLSEYETYLPMFGDEGTKLLARIRTFVSSV
ncbi:MAG: hypothetical protein WC137_02535 [Alphaproteobacteria bacterium]